MQTKWLLTGALVLLAGCGGGGGSSLNIAAPVRRLVLSFTEESGEFGKSSSIFSILPDGTGKTRLTSPTRTQDGDGQPDLNSAGNQIVFISSRNSNLGSSNIWKVATAGGAPMQLTTNNGSFDPQWSPDGKRIAFTFDGDVFIMSSDGTMQTNLTPNSPQSYDVRPDFSPDGKRLVFSSSRKGLANAGGLTYHRHIYSMNLDGSDVKQLTNSQNYADFPHYSPDGKHIAFSISGSPSSQIAVINADGSGLRTLADKLSLVYGILDFSADGRELFYITEDTQAPANGVALYALSLSDGKQRRIIRLFEGAVSSADKISKRR